MSGWAAHQLNVIAKRFKDKAATVEDPSQTEQGIHLDSTSETKDRKDFTSKEIPDLRTETFERKS